MTGNRPGDLRERQERPFQFSLRGLMALVLAVAFGLSVVSLKKGNWANGLLAAVSVWIILGLISQVRDLWSTFHARPDLSSDERWGWRFAILWRVGVACLLLSHYSVTVLTARGILVLPERPDGFPGVGANLRNALLCLSLLIVLYSVPARTEKRRRSPRSRFLGIAGGIFAVIWCFLVWTDETLIHHLVNLALQGIEATWAPRFAIEGLDPDMTARSRAFFWRSLFSVAFVPVSLVLTHQLSRQWGRELRLRLILAGLLALSLAMTVWYPIWVYTSGLRRTSPMMAQAMEVGPLHLWVSALLLVIVLVTAAAYRVVQAPEVPARAAEEDWRRDPLRYYHERPGIIVLLVVALIGVDVVSSWLVAWPRGSRGVHSYVSFASLFIESFVYDPVRYMSLAVLLLGLHRAWTGWSRATGSLGGGPAALPLRRFCAIWLAMFLTAVTGIPTIVWFSFAVWLGPWDRLPWP